MHLAETPTSSKEEKNWRCGLAAAEVVEAASQGGAEGDEGRRGEAKRDDTAFGDRLSPRGEGVLGFNSQYPLILVVIGQNKIITTNYQNNHKQQTHLIYVENL